MITAVMGTSGMLNHVTIAGDGGGGEGEADGGRGGEVGGDLGAALLARLGGAVQPQHEPAGPRRRSSRNRGRRRHPDSAESPKNRSIDPAARLVVQRGGGLC